MATETVFQLIGIAGFFSYMAGFAALQLGFIDGNGTVYTVSNLLGACLVLISLTTAFNLASLLIQIAWIMIGLYGLWRRLRHWSDERANVLSCQDAHASKVFARRRGSHA